MATVKGKSLTFEADLSGSSLCIYLISVEQNQKPILNGCLHSDVQSVIYT